MALYIEALYHYRGWGPENNPNKQYLIIIVHDERNTGWHLTDGQQSWPVSHIGTVFVLELVPNLHYCFMILLQKSQFTAGS